jgi:hypothetical protein
MTARKTKTSPLARVKDASSEKTSFAGLLILNLLPNVRAIRNMATYTWQVHNCQTLGTENEQCMQHETLEGFLVVWRLNDRELSRQAAGAV